MDVKLIMCGSITFQTALKRLIKLNFIELFCSTISSAELLYNKKSQKKKFLATYSTYKLRVLPKFFPGFLLELLPGFS